MECFPELHELCPIHSRCLFIIELEIEFLLILLLRTLGLNNPILLELCLIIQLPLVFLLPPDIKLTALAPVILRQLLLWVYCISILYIRCIFIVIVLVAS